MSKTPPNARVITQIAMGDCEGSPLIVALCNDGTAWKLVVHDEWVALPRIPQPGETKAAVPRGKLPDIFRMD